MTGLCSGLLRDRSEAEDAAQQTFLAAHRALLNGSTPREPAAWLATIARNECWARIRARMREPLPVEQIDTEGAAPDPLAEAIRRADLAALWRAIAELPRQQRDALLLREFGGLSYDELAEALAVTGPAVESLLFRARQGVRARLRTAYAAVSGAGWAEALLRVLAGASGTAAPVAAKVVAVAGVGAAVATGGAVVAPSLLDHHAATRPRAASAAPPPVHVVHVVQVVHPAAPQPPTRRVLVAVRKVTAVPSADGADNSGDGSVSRDEQHVSSRDSGGRTERDSEHASRPAAESSDQSSGDSSGDSSPDPSAAPPAGGTPPATTTTTSTTTTDAGVTVAAPNPPVTVVPPPGDETPGGDG